MAVTVRVGSGTGILLGAAETHDFSPQGGQPVELAEFLGEVQQILDSEGIL
jgi:hypothetical protein